MLHKGTWKAIKKKLLSDREDYLQGLLSNASQDRTNELRGRIRVIDEILERYPRELFEDENEF